VIAMTPPPITPLRLFDARDLEWIDELLLLVEESVDQPWRVLLERIEHAPLRAGSRAVGDRARREITNALRRVLGGRAERTRIARRLRERVLGHPALDANARAARIRETATELGIEAADVESLLWADLARERPVVLPHGRPEPQTLAAIANVDRIQRAMRRAREVELRVWAEPRDLVRFAARCGLIVHVTREPDGAFVLRLLGPLALVHSTTVYGRALGALVPLLAEHARFELDIHCELVSGPYTLRVEPPALLPPYALRVKPALADRLARDLERRGCRVEREPASIVVEALDDEAPPVLFPDLAVEYRGTRCFVEVVGFSTSGYLADKLARYAAANAPVILCVDVKRSRALEEHPSIVEFTKRIDPDVVVERIDQEAP
jgi:predicted nuclease of restriction endonuclease-like RecB superfamily